MKIIKGCILVAAALIVSAMALVSCLHGGKMTTITVTPFNQYMARGSTQQFTAVATLSDGQTVNWTLAATWASLDSTVVATISNTVPTNGLATASSTTTGTTTITATDPINGISSSVTVTVADPTSITVMPVNPYMGKGAVHQFTAVAIFSSPTITQDLTSSPSVTWSSDSNIATLGTTTGSFSLVTASTTTPGTVTITALDTVSGIKGTTLVTVTDTPLVSITVTSPDPTILVNGTEQYTATGNYSAPPTLDFTSSVTWSSSPEGVVTISNTGLATAGTTTGTTTIIATDPITGHWGSKTLTVQ